MAHNAFAVPVLVPTFGLLNWTKAEIEQIDVQTRKIICMKGNFHPNTDVDHYYVQCRKGGRGLKSIQIAFETKIVSTRQHFLTNKKQNKYIDKVVIHEDEKLIRVGKELLLVLGTTDDPLLKPINISQRYLQHVLQNKQESYTNRNSFTGSSNERLLLIKTLTTIRRK